ncbi:hypothetical protein Veis_2199 [Verminephrobacter eiseniae EF01-2]|uniref:Uncharacterized protein n=1 Tax=Verminephrobacter eiseniae (strain EF01-2) TaxID=391735 RepID=A1WJZ0_VEREI|nr:hypothetical protein Veis_2199 [Verminephrobacter eiseniae EF01-2]
MPAQIWAAPGNTVVRPEQHQHIHHLAQHHPGPRATGQVCVDGAGHAEVWLAHGNPGQPCKVRGARSALILRMGTPGGGGLGEPSRHQKKQLEHF